MALVSCASICAMRIAGLKNPLLHRVLLLVAYIAPVASKWPDNHASNRPLLADNAWFIACYRWNRAGIMPVLTFQLFANAHCLPADPLVSFGFAPL
jgi:hypothetical protein